MCILVIVVVGGFFKKSNKIYIVLFGILYFIIHLILLQLFS